MDLIDRDKLDSFKFRSASERMDLSVEYMSGWNDAVYHIEANAPRVDAKPVRHGKWIYSNDFHWYTASCNKCGYQRRTDIKAEGWNQWKFCPNCGAKMDEVEE